MKTIITILLLTLSCQTFAQTLQDYIKAYEADCYTEVFEKNGKRKNFLTINSKQ